MPDLGTVVTGEQPGDLVFTSPRGGPLRSGSFRWNVLHLASARPGLAGVLDRFV